MLQTYGRTENDVSKRSQLLLFGANKYELFCMNVFL